MTDSAKSPRQAPTIDTCKLQKNEDWMRPLHCMHSTEMQCNVQVQSILDHRNLGAQTTVCFESEFVLGGYDGYDSQLTDGY